MNVYDLNVGGQAEIVSMNFTGGAAARLSSLGITTGKRITVLAFSLFKSSVLIGCGAVRLSLRKGAAQRIEVKVLRGI